MDNLIAPFLSTRWPLLVVWLVALVYSVVYWCTYLRPALLAFVGVTINLLVLLVQAWGVRFLVDFPGEPTGDTWPKLLSSWVATTAASVDALLSAIGWALVLVAVFVGRRAAPAGVPPETV